jgi:DNA polymerase-3 subunit beta
MKATCDRAALVHWVQAASAVATRRSPKPILGSVRLDAEPERLTLVATDLEVGVRIELSQIEVADAGAALVPADRLHQILRELDADTVAIESADQETEITAPGARFKMLGDDPDDFPNVPAFPEEGGFEVGADDLLAMIERTLFATAREHTRYALNGVLWEVEGDALVLVATDGHRLSLAKGKCNGGPEEKTAAIVPAKAVALLERTLGMIDDPKAVVRVALSEREILVQSPETDGGRWTVYSRLVEGHFPKYEDLIPADYETKISLPTDAFGAAVRRAALLTTEESRGIHMKLAPQEVVLTSRAPEMGEAEVRLPVEYGGEEIELVFNPSYLIDAMKVIDASEFTFAFKSAAKPGLLSEGRLFKYVVMPVSSV